MTSGIEVSSPTSAAGSTAGTRFRDDPFILEGRGWSSPDVACAPKLLALDSLMNLAAPDPVASVSYHSRGNVLVIAGDAPQRARDCAAALAASLPVTLLAGAAFPAGAFSAWKGDLASLEGYLGEFSATNPALHGPAPAVPRRFDRG